MFRKFNAVLFAESAPFPRELIPTITTPAMITYIQRVVVACEPKKKNSVARTKYESMKNKKAGTRKEGRKMKRT